MLQLKESAVMSNTGIENRVIRIPEQVRQQTGLNLGDFIVISTEAFQVHKALVADLAKSQEHSFVTKSMFDKLDGVVNDFGITKHITMGCDPEFFLHDIRDGSLISPSYFFKKYDTVGYDGMSVEIRPQPSVSPAALVNNIYQLLSYAKNAIVQKGMHNVGMYAQSTARLMNNQLIFAGFHVHMGIPATLLNPNSPIYDEVQLMLSRALDYYVGTLAVIAEGTDSSRRTSAFTAYGKVGDCRVDLRTLEYRVPGGALLKHPKITYGLISMCSLVAHDLLERIRILTKDYSITITDPMKTLEGIYPGIITDVPQLIEIISAHHLGLAEKEAIKILDDFKLMMNYEKYHEAVRDFMIFARAPISTNICENWMLN